ncbi:hypothetical protein AUEXF2481DRAFT_24639 [Aureobasidium subglaciale EXF-2481]|uniref:Uncharacterized protein n=1 Tax=Aureobasidium subglaciale (strain EXF-2481) TaxID=1043005 RepID=A0A074Z1U3_AURSE|nr:uncharacterized protein AUEXF2481DRAFT_24639 [Aureobasidium subglaciale EXF-2481]KER00298.1 hypothetical protein AUEXF2481DRAFT_24639 [Aureobasidium subglaciale EXF-2481]
MSFHSRVLLLFSILELLTCFASATLFSPLLSVLDWSQQVPSNQTFHDLPKRAIDPTSCPTGYKNCANLGAPGLCCANSAVCAPDQAGHVACCPSGAACTGAISSIITSGVIASGGSLRSTATASPPLTVSASSATSIATSGGGLIIASGHGTTSSAITTTASSAATATTTTGDGFILVGSSTAATIGSSAVRNAQLPYIAHLIIGLLELLAF